MFGAIRIGWARRGLSSATKENYTTDYYDEFRHYSSSISITPLCGYLHGTDTEEYHAALDLVLIHPTLFSVTPACSVFLLRRDFYDELFFCDVIIIRDGLSS